MREREVEGGEGPLYISQEPTRNSLIDPIGNTEAESHIRSGITPLLITPLLSQDV